jgi:hypothetical protein
MDESQIEVADGFTSYAGPDAVQLFAARTIARACRLWAEHRIKVNRQYTPTAMLKAASRITGKAYKQGQHAEAAADLKTWADTMQAALPITDRRTS